MASLLVRDLDETLAFYGKLGFRRTGTSPEGEPDTWAEVRRGDVVLQFYTDPPHGTPSEPIFSGTLYVYPLDPGDVEALAAQWRGLVDFAWGPEEMPYGQREFAVRDPNGYFLAFAEPA